jgi:hypothetical protein
MTDLVREVSEKANLTEAQAEKAVNVVADYMKANMHSAIGDAVDVFMKTGKLPDMSDIVAGEMRKGFGGIFGSKK